MKKLSIWKKGTRQKRKGGEIAEGINEYSFIQCQRFREGVKWAAIRRLSK